MLEHTPPRRDPRLLLVDAHRCTILLVALDAFEVRAIRELALPLRTRDQAFLVGRTLRELRPSCVALAGASSAFAATCTAVAKTQGLAVQTLSDAERRAALHRAPSTRILRRTYRELVALQLALQERQALRLAASLFIHRELPRRRYAGVAL